MMIILIMMMLIIAIMETGAKSIIITIRMIKMIKMTIFYTYDSI